MSQSEVQGPQGSSDTISPPDQAQQSQKTVQGMENSGNSHRMSIALIIGATIALIGLILLLYGLFGTADFRRSDGINIDLWWGLVMVAFGAIMGIGGYIASRRQTAH